MKLNNRIPLHMFFLTHQKFYIKKLEKATTIPATRVKNIDIWTYLPEII